MITNKYPRGSKMNTLINEACYWGAVWHTHTPSKYEIVWPAWVTAVGANIFLPLFSSFEVGHCITYFFKWGTQFNITHNKTEVSRCGQVFSIFRHARLTGLWRNETKADFEFLYSFLKLFISEQWYTWNTV